MSADIIARLEKLNQIIDGGKGISWQMGEDCATRYDHMTGKPYTISRPAELTCSSAKLRAIVDLYQALPDILDGFRVLEAEGARDE